MRKFLVLCALFTLVIVGACGKTTTTTTTTQATTTTTTQATTTTTQVKVKELKLDTTNVKTQFILGDEFTLEGLVVTAYYTDGTNKIITDYTVDNSGYKQDKVGSYRILIKYTENNKEVVGVYQVKVVNILDTVNYLIGIEVSPRNVEFLKGTEFNTDTLVVTAIYSDGSRKDVTSKVTINSSKYKKDVVGVYEIVIEYSETYGEGINQVEIFWDSFYFARVVETLSE